MARVRSPWISIAATLALALWYALPASQAVEPSGPRVVPAPKLPPSQTDPSAHRRREGEQLDQLVGSFQSAEGKMLFVAADGRERFTVLANQNLERVERTLADGHERSLWKISGTITEYRGANYLLISRALRKNSPPPGPDLP